MFWRGRSDKSPWGPEPRAKTSPTLPTFGMTWQILAIPGKVFSFGEELHDQAQVYCMRDRQLLWRVQSLKRAATWRFLGNLSSASASSFRSDVDRMRAGRGATRAEDAQGTPTQSHISPSILVYEDNIYFILF